MQDAVNGLYPRIVAAYMDGLVAPNHTTFIMLETLSKLTPERNGEFLRYDGKALPW